MEVGENDVDVDSKPLDACRSRWEGGSPHSLFSLTKGRSNFSRVLGPNPVTSILGNHGVGLAVAALAHRDSRQKTISARARLLLSSSGHTTLQVQEQYRYGALPEDSIRLLELHSDHDENELFGSLVTRRIGEVPQYIALSYVWRDPTCAGYLFCQNGHPTDAGRNLCPDHASNIIDFVRTLPLSRSLNDALRRIRRSLSHLGHVVTVWADAICIYSYRTATKHLGTLRFAPQLFEGLDFTGKSGQAIFFCIFNGLIAQPVQFLPSFHVTSAPPILAPRSPF
jgi:hypothetical protein